MGVDPVSLGVITIAAAAAYGGYAMSQGGKKKEGGQDAGPAAPAAPTQGEAKDAASKQILARKRTGTILTTPYGVKEDASVKAPTLLGSGSTQGGNTTLG